MKTSLIVLTSIVLLNRPAAGQGILFDFENVAVHTPFPITLTVGGVTAQFSGTGQGYSIQLPSSAGVVPVGFSGNCIYPNSIYGSDLTVTFSRSVTFFSILYAPHELACDTSATMRVMAYYDAVTRGTATTNAQPGTWPSETLAITNAQGFNKVVVHYDAPPPPPPCDYGVIFMADNMMIIPAPPPIVLTGAVRLGNGNFQFSFTNAPATACSIWATTNLSVPASNWTSLGAPIEVSPGQYQFTDTQSTGVAQHFYCVRVP